MSSPTLTAKPSVAFSDEGKAHVEFGPDATHTPKHPPKINQDKPPRPVEQVIGKLGTNKKLRSPVRRLQRERAKESELSDLERLTNWYYRIAKMVRPFRPVLATALEDQAEDCANCWFDLAENNDTVRRYILGIIEGGDWGKVIAAHTPIFLAIIPEKAMERIMLKGMGMFAQQMAAVEDLPEEWNERG